eukprot:5276920-Pleurochrysis_carterae.AAC.3
MVSTIQKEGKRNVFTESQEKEIEKSLFQKSELQKVAERQHRHPSTRNVCTSGAAAAVGEPLVAKCARVVPAVRHALDVGVAVQRGQREGVLQPDHVHVREEHAAPDLQASPCTARNRCRARGFADPVNRGRRRDLLTTDGWSERAAVNFSLRSVEAALSLAAIHRTKEARSRKGRLQLKRSVLSRGARGGLLEKETGRKTGRDDAVYCEAPMGTERVPAESRAGRRT